MPLISGDVFLPDGIQARRLVYHVSIHTDGGYAIDADSWREGTTRVETDRRTGFAEREFPARSGDDYYDLRVELLDGDREENYLPPLDQPPWSFQLTADTTWRAIIEAPSTLPITPSDVAAVRAVLAEVEALTALLTHIGVDTDDVPYFDVTGVPYPDAHAVLLDTDNVPYFV